MRVPLEWLLQYCAPELDVHQLAERLAMTGTEVERIEHHGVQELGHFVVGQVLERRKHPNADRLSVCMVEVGRSAPSQIVCGAPNVRAGQTVAVARPGAIMPDGSTLQKAKLRGQISDGMILAEDELAIGTDHEGIIVLPDGPPAGMPLAELLPIATDVLVLEITPNRPDCLGIYGIARELHAATGAPLAPPPWEVDPVSHGDLQGVEIVNDAGGELCPRFTARIFEHVRVEPSPTWLKARLMAAGQRPICNVVDITNYVMLLTGQPLHAFDLERVAGARLTVRRAREREQLQTLDGQTRTLGPEIVVIEDADGPASVAGVMGGSRGEVEAGTSTVLIEAATWDGPNIHRTSLALGLRSEASSRFEKQLQPEQAIWGQAVAAQLIVELCGASVRPGTVDIGGPGPEAEAIVLRDARISSLLGMEIPRQRARAILDALQCTTAPVDGGLEVTPPAFRRGDISREADLIEEVARLHGLDRLPATLPTRRSAFGALTDRQRLHRRASDALTAFGLHEVVGWSFTGPEAAAKLRAPGAGASAGAAAGAGAANAGAANAGAEASDAGEAITLANPLSRELSQLRTTLLTSLLDVAQYNHSRGAGALRLFETGAVYLRRDGQPGALPDEPQHLAALLSGPVTAPSWRNPDPRPADLFAAKGVLAALLDALRAGWSLRAESAPFLHPGRAARIRIEGVDAGWLGELHPALAAERDLSDPVALFELDLDALPLPPPVVYEDLISFPEAREDLAVVVDQAIPATRVLATIRAAGSPLLVGAEVFDVYRDPDKLGPDSVSLAIRLVFRAADRTLTDEEVARRRAQIVVALEHELGGRIRDR